MTKEIEKEIATLVRATSNLVTLVTVYALVTWLYAGITFLLETFI